MVIRSSKSKSTDILPIFRESYLRAPSKNPAASWSWVLLATAQVLEFDVYIYGFMSNSFSYAARRLCRLSRKQQRSTSVKPPHFKESFQVKARCCFRVLLPFGQRLSSTSPSRMGSRNACLAPNLTRQFERYREPPDANREMHTERVSSRKCAKLGFLRERQGGGYGVRSRRTWQQASVPRNQAFERDATLPVCEPSARHSLA